MDQKQSKSNDSDVTASAKKTRGPTVPIPKTLEKVRGYRTLTIYKMGKSPFYYVRLFEGGKILRKSTKTDDRRDAINFAERFFVEIKTKLINQEPISSRSGFEVCALGLQKENRSRFERGELSQKKLDNDDYRLKKDLLPFFRKHGIADVDYRLISEYISTLNSKDSDRSLSSSSIKIHLSHIKTILKYALLHMLAKKTKAELKRIQTVSSIQLMQAINPLELFLEECSVNSD